MEEPEIEGLPRGRGFWSVTRHADVVRVSLSRRRVQLGAGTTIVDLPRSPTS